MPEKAGIRRHIPCTEGKEQATGVREIFPETGERSMIDPNPQDNEPATRDRALPAQATTKEEADRILQEGTGSPDEPGSGAGSIAALGTPGGGSEVGGLAGTNVGDGAPGNVDLNDFFDSSDTDRDDTA
jgi:hypothetical protein